MPWKETDVLMERVKFVLEYEKGCQTMAELCRAFGISRKTGYETLKKYREEGMEGLRERSRAPHSHPNRTAREIEKKILEVRRRRPNWGSKKILKILRGREPELALPARSTTNEILKRAGLTRSPVRRRKATPSELPLTIPERANQVWCTDFKGWFRLGNGQRCDPLTLTDGYSRYALHCKAMSLPKLEEVQKQFERAFREYGLPDVIRSDNGVPFASNGLGGLTRLSVWWIRLGITPERIEPGKPQQNGAHERFHRTLKQETANPPKATMRGQQRAFTHFCTDYNEVRPHEALDMETPWDFYEASSRPFPSKLGDPEYPGTFELRRVRSNGGISFRRKQLYLSMALRGQLVGLEPLDDGAWEAHFGPAKLARIHESGVVAPHRPGER